MQTFAPDGKWLMLLEVISAKSGKHLSQLCPLVGCMAGGDGQGTLEEYALRASSLASVADKLLGHVKSALSSLEVSRIGPCSLLSAVRGSVLMPHAPPT